MLVHTFSGSGLPPPYTPKGPVVTEHLFPLPSTCPEGPSSAQDLSSPVTITLLSRLYLFHAPYFPYLLSGSSWPFADDILTWSVSSRRVVSRLRRRLCFLRLSEAVRLHDFRYPELLLSDLYIPFYLPYDVRTPPSTTQVADRVT